MIYALLTGMKYGLILSVTFSLGPVFFSLLQTGIQKGFRSGALMAAGIALSDLMYAFVCQLGLSQLVKQFESNIAAVGGLIAIGFGIATFMKKSRLEVADNGTNQPQRVGTFRFISKGFLLNSLNPAVVLFWIGMASVASAKIEKSPAEAYIFLAGIISILFSSDLLKVYFARRISNYLSSHTLDWMNRIVGLCLTGFGVWLIYSALTGRIQ
ncbi:LysE family transporter [Cytophagaceae bacterium YF14B1]|uniref:LysE family transporter n=1 Tax=Xanthocytophaga flava TaxID=3048013 RepID=A0AAE3U489_9BACT|nr:LysE family transporter [Xanthocytophaga flavus]MDJ1466310.1 LysE family transporter [Xanthocytophaga flavus]MDJ1478981.1 LysE family transporter [Xanthocytophaga flavus]